MLQTFGILGAGSIAKAFALGAKTSRHGRVMAVASRSLEKAQGFAREHQIHKAYGSYDELLLDRELTAIYVCTPHPLHARWAIAALEAGKHVLCEKPFALNYYEAMKMIEVAREQGVMILEAFMYRCHPQTAKLVELVRSNAIGEVRVVHATFSFQAGYNAESRLFKNELAGGGIMDVGCYPVSMARLIAGVARGAAFADPLELKGAGHLAPTGVDTWALATLKFPGDVLAHVATGVELSQENTVKIFGAGGQITLPNPWVCNREKAEPGKIIVRRAGQDAEEIDVASDQTSFGYEIDVFARAIADGSLRPAHPAMSNEDTLGNMRSLDAWRAQVGCIYEQEKPAHHVPTVSGRPLAVRPTHNMRYGDVPGVHKKVSRLVLGVDNQHTMPHAAVMFDDWFERGGNAFDTAFVYGGGVCERMLGAWAKNRGVRGEVVIVGKGAHTPFCDPKSITQQLMQSLERLQTDYVDVYILHRDNPQIQVGEFVDVLNEHVKAGRIRAFGGSNWELTRVDQASAYAASKGLQGFSVVSNNFSLARMVTPVWGGCIQSADAASRRWFEDKGLALFAWSSQARGFFVEGRAHPEKTSDAELVRCWYAEDNFQRLVRAKELAERHGVLPINVALAYVLCQPFPSFALVGPRTLAETRTTLPALDLTLSPDELRYLNLEVP
jgi:predicted dehydrogenase/aryl-alcohol dehydrogenase-like predicted oxidoreductase